MGESWSNEANKRFSEIVSAMGDKLTAQFKDNFRARLYLRLDFQVILFSFLIRYVTRNTILFSILLVFSIFGYFFSGPGMAVLRELDFEPNVISGMIESGVNNNNNLY